MAKDTPYVDVQNLSKSFGALNLFSNISFSIAEGQKVGLIAKNGMGKSTLLSVLAGKEGHDTGDIIFRRDLTIGFLEQSPQFDPQESVLDACFNHHGEEEKVLKAKQVLTQLKIRDLNQPMGQLSGGQQKRVALANVLLMEPDLLILDEPTNHLDMPSKDVLKEAIKAFDGTAIIVSHDREFLDGLVSKVYEFGGGKVREHLGGIYDFLRTKKISDLNQLGAAKPSEKTEKMEKTASVSEIPQEPLKKALSYEEHKALQKKISRAEKSVKESEAKIEKLEAKLKELDEMLMKPENASNMVMVTEYTDVKRELDEEVERWEKASEALESLTQ